MLLLPFAPSCPPVLARCSFLSNLAPFPILEWQFLILDSRYYTIYMYGAEGDLDAINIRLFLVQAPVLITIMVLGIALGVRLIKNIDSGMRKAALFLYLVLLFFL